MDFDDEHQDQEEEMEEEEEESAAAAAIQQNSSAFTRQLRLGSSTTGELARRPTSYRECLKNHALSVGGHAVDGCGEFMAAGDEGTLDGLRCAACNCHRNFHRKETNTHQHYPHSSQHYRPSPPAGYLHLTPPPPYHRHLALPSGSGGGGGYSGQEEEDVSNPSSSGPGTRKRFRTKFTAEQKEKMLEFAESVGWRIRREEEAAVERFCEETGVTRHVLKVWIHNNKNSRGKIKP